MNAYVNALLQMLHFTLPLRLLAQHHCVSACGRDHCLLCEAGFLFKMLDIGHGANCRAGNFSRTFSHMPQGVLLCRLCSAMTDPAAQLRHWDCSRPATPPLRAIPMRGASSSAAALYWNNLVASMAVGLVRSMHRLSTRSLARRQPCCTSVQCAALSAHAPAMCLCTTCAILSRRLHAGCVPFTRHMCGVGRAI